MSKEHHRTASLILFLLLAYAGLWILFGVGRWLAIPFAMDPGVPGGKFFLIGAAWPSISAFLAILIHEKRRGIGVLLRRALAWRFSPFWYLAALLIPFAVNALNSVVAVVFMDATAPAEWFVPAFGPGFLIFFLLFNGFGEEIGWRGLALPVLQRHFGSAGGNLVLGVLWALWHLPLFWLKGSYQYGDSIVLFVLLLTAWSLIIGVLVNRCRGSILPAILFHESANAIAFNLRYPGSMMGYGVWILAAGLVVIWMPKPWFRWPCKPD